MVSLLAATLSPFYASFAPEVRTTYVSLGSIVEDRPMQVTSFRAGYATEDFGRIGFHNWDVSSLTGRRDDVHRGCLYHTEAGATWNYDWRLAEGLTLRSGLIWAWTFYRGFEKRTGNGTFQWLHLDESLENDYLVPYVSLRRCYIQANYFYFKIGVRRRIPVFGFFDLTPSVHCEGGNGRNCNRVLGKRTDGGDWGAGGVSSVTFRLEARRAITENLSVFGFVEQYEITGAEARRQNEARNSRCAHNDWFLCGLGCRLSF